MAVVCLYKLLLFFSIVIAEQKAKSKDDQGPQGDNKLLTELSKFLTLLGISDPDVQIYIDGKPGPRLPELIFLVIISTLSRLQFSLNAGELMAKKPNENLDGYPFTLGVACLLKQFPSEIFETVVTYMAQYIRSYCGEQGKANQSSLLPEVTNAMIFMERLFEVKKCSKEQLEKLLPRPINDLK